MRLDQIRLDEIRLDQIRLDWMSDGRDLRLRSAATLLRDLYPLLVSGDEIGLGTMRGDQIRCNEIRLDQIRLDEMRLDEMK